MIRLLMLVCLIFSVSALADAEVVMVRGGAPEAVVVVSDNPSRTAEYAARELIDHVMEAAGVRLPLAKESEIPGEYKSRIFIGVTEAAKAIGIEPDTLGTDEAVLRTYGNDLYILGDEEMDADPLDVFSRHGGTMFGVYEIIERYLGVVWAWPGELGRYVPGRRELVIAEKLDETFAPSINTRMVGGRYTLNIARGASEYNPRVKRISFSREGLEQYAHDTETYLRRHRMGRGRAASVGHQFSGWWNRYGEEHPEWFMMNEKGVRGRAEGMRWEHVSMCVSNPDLHRYIVRLMVNQWERAGVRNMRLGEVDGSLFCWCPDCLAWDGPQYSEDELPEFLHDGPYTPRVVSDRYARFWKSVYKMAEERIPEPTVATYLYVNYFPAPEEVDEIPPGVWGYFTPWRGHTIYFPMADEALEWKKEQWKGWADTGMSMVYRPNYLHGGYTMPYLETRQSGQMFKYAYENGMKGAMFDTLCGEWAVQGPMLYMHMRLLAKPDLETEEILNEYYSVFGPAEKQVREYFGYWKDYAVENDVSERMAWRRFNLIVHELYPPESFTPAEEILGRALEAAKAADSPEYFERVLFLIAGLEHAKLSGRLAAIFDGDREIPRGTARFREARRALADLVRFRRAHENMNIFDFTYLASKELRADNWNLDALFE